MRRVSTSPKKSTYRKTDFCHVKGLANAIWASNFTGPTSFKFEKPVKPISRLSSLSPFREVQTLILQNRLSNPSSSSSSFPPFHESFTYEQSIPSLLMYTL